MNKRKMGKIAKRRGYIAEKNVIDLLVKLFKDLDINAYRTSSSGSGKYNKGDIILEINILTETGITCKNMKGIHKYRIEIKSKKHKGIHNLGKFIEDNKGCFLIYNDFIIFDVTMLNVIDFIYNTIDISAILKYTSIISLADKYLNNKKEKIDIVIIKNNDKKKNYYLGIMKKNKLIQLVKLLKCKRNEKI